MRARLIAGLVVVSVLTAGCSNGELLVENSGGEGTTHSSDRNAFGNSARNLSDEQRRRFEVGDSFFTQNWVTAPASTEARDGLGPLLNAQSCSSCHVRDGRGSPDGPAPGLLLRVGDAEGHPDYGGQIQDRSIIGVDPEATVRTIYVEVPGTYADGTTYALRRPVHSLEDLAYGEIEVDVPLSPRLALPVFGVGLIEAIPEEDILELADPDDTDGDGISGRPNYVADLINGGKTLGRFGWKANVPSVAQQVASAFNEDIGITSPVLPEESCAPVQTACAEAISGGSPEISQDIFDDVVFYNRTLAVPARRNLDDPDVITGAGLFEQVGCVSCHRPGYVTGDHSIDALVEQEIFPFTDLLLHDMGPDLADDRPDGEATGSEWRTPPLWGLGLNDVVNGNTTLLHDGRARNIEEAILWHDGEAASAREEFTKLTAVQRSQLISFLESL